jgi:putative membrane protein
MRLAPLSIPYRAVQRGISLVFTLAFVLFSTSSFLGPFGPLASVGILGLAVLTVVGYEVAYFRRFDYKLTSDTFDVRSGVFSRRNREIPLRRIQNVDISRNVAQRVLGIAAVDFETAGGGQTEGSLRYVTFEEAKRLQSEISRLKRGTTEEGEPVPEPEEEELFALADRELTLVGLLSFDLRVPGLLLFLFSGSVPFVPQLLPTDTATLLGLAGIAALVVVVLLFSWVASAVVAVLNYYGFRLTRTDDELQYERGLLQRYDGSIPLDKVQTLTVTDNPLKRYFGYATLQIETAGYSGGAQDGSARGSEAAVPLATRERVVELANEIEAFGDAEFRRPPKRIRRRYVMRYLIALGVLTAVLYAVNVVVPQPIPWYVTAVALPALPVAAHLKWKHRGYWLGDDHVVTRNGVWNRETKIVPYYRVQTVIDSRTVFQRRWRVATVTVDTAGSLSILGRDAAAVDIDDTDADDLRDELSARLRIAVAERRSRRPRPTMTDADQRDAAVSEAGQTAAVTADGESVTEEGSTAESRRPSSGSDARDGGNDTVSKNGASESPDGDGDDGFVFGTAVESETAGDEAATETEEATDEPADGEATTDESSERAPDDETTADESDSTRDDA